MRNHRVLFFALTTPTKQVQWALFLFSGTGTKKFFEKVWESRKKIRQRESERAISQNPVGVIHMNNKIQLEMVQVPKQK